LAGTSSTTKFNPNTHLKAKNEKITIVDPVYLCRLYIVYTA
jgi:hypothetical protein